MKLLDDKTIVKEYFNSIGFDRWQRIYENGQVNKVQLDIREGHQQTIDKVINWLKVDNLSNLSICDAGCGTGSLTIPLAELGANVTGSDISEKMILEAKNKALDKGLSINPSFSVQDLESITGSYHTVICLDVLIHYPDEKMVDMIGHLSSLATNRLILTFAPYTLGFSILKKIGSFFPGASKATRAYLHKEKELVLILKNHGFAIKRTEMTSTKFYFSRLLEAVREE